MIHQVILRTADDLTDFGVRLGRTLRGGETIELVGDIGAGKTTLTKGIARGMDIADEVQSPTFTISRVYDAPHNLRLAHYDFYRLEDAGIMQAELNEATQDDRTVTIIEWAAVVSDVLPRDTLRIDIATQADNSRKLTLQSGGAVSEKIITELSR